MGKYVELLGAVLPTSLRNRRYHGIIHCEYFLVQCRDNQLVSLQHVCFDVFILSSQPIPWHCFPTKTCLEELDDWCKGVSHAVYNLPFVIRKITRDLFNYFLKSCRGHTFLIHFLNGVWKEDKSTILHQNAHFYSHRLNSAKRYSSPHPLNYLASHYPK